MDIAAKGSFGLRWVGITAIGPRRVRRYAPEEKKKKTKKKKNVKPLFFFFFFYAPGFYRGVS